jgi:hypothetical protein
MLTTRPRHHAVVRDCSYVAFSDSSPSWKGTLEVEGHGLVTFKVAVDGSGRHRAFLAALGATESDRPGAMVSRPVVVELGQLQSRDGTKPVVARWLPVEEEL